MGLSIKILHTCLVWVILSWKRTLAITVLSVTIDQLNQALGTDVEPNGVDTVGGIVYQNLVHMPRMGDSIVEENPCHNRSFRFGQACNAR